MFSIIKLLITKYKKYNFNYIILIFNNQVLKTKKIKIKNLKYNYILLYIKNIISKIINYQKFLPQLPIYIAIIINFTFY